MAEAALVEDAKKRKSLRPLARLLPYMKRYSGMVFAALFFLTIAAATTLTLPLAVRRMIDHGFSGADTTFIANYFSMLVVIAAVLALASACRYYFVITLGERVVSDLRRDVFAHVTNLSPSFFDTAQSGEIVSRLTADTTQIKSAVGATASMALRNVIMGIGALGMMVITSPKLSGLVSAAIPFIVCRWSRSAARCAASSRAAQDTLANATAYASEQIGAVRTLQAFTNEGLVTAASRRRSRAAFEAARASVLARAMLTFFAIFAMFSSVVAACSGSARATCSTARSRPARSASSCSIRCSPPARSARCRRSGASSARRQAPPNGWPNCSTRSRPSRRRRTPKPLPADAPRRRRLLRRALFLSDAARPPGTARAELRR